MIWNWIVPGSFNIAYGEMSVLFGILFVTTSLALALIWAYTGYRAYWGHLAEYSRWQPLVQLSPQHV